MSVPAEATVAPAQEASPFDAEEQASLDREDAEAGLLIGRLLSFLFLYTIAVAPLVAWWTWDATR